MKIECTFNWHPELIVREYPAYIVALEATQPYKIMMCSSNINNNSKQVTCFPFQLHFLIALQATHSTGCWKHSSSITEANHSNLVKIYIYSHDSLEL